MLRNTLFILALIYPLVSFTSAGKLHLPGVNLFNRSLQAGSVLRDDVTWQGIPADQLREGSKPAYEDDWARHSTFTTSLFAVKPGERYRVRFMARSDAGASDQPSLWVNVRFYDRHGVYLGAQKDMIHEVPFEWQQQSVDIAPTDDKIVYAEIWFVKFSDADETGEVKRSIYVAALKPEG